MKRDKARKEEKTNVDETKKNHRIPLQHKKQL